MCCEKSCKALAAASTGDVPGTELSGERTARLLCSGVGTDDASLRGQAGAVDRVAHAHPGDRADPGALRLPHDPRAVESRGLEGWQRPGVPAVQGRGPGAA